MEICETKESLLKKKKKKNNNMHRSIERKSLALTCFFLTEWIDSIGRRRQAEWIATHAFIIEAVQLEPERESLAFVSVFLRAPRVGWDVIFLFSAILILLRGKNPFDQIAMREDASLARVAHDLFFTLIILSSLLHLTVSCISHIR